MLEIWRSNVTQTTMTHVDMQFVADMKRKQPDKMHITPVVITYEKYIDNYFYIRHIGLFCK